MTPKVLLVDDAEEFRLLAAQFLAIEWPDITVDEWDPPARGEIPADYPLGGYDAVLLDFQLGIGDGLTWLARLVKRADCPPVVFLTGAGDENVAFKAMKGGAFDYLTKRDLSKARLVEAVRAAAAERAAHTPGSRAQRREATQAIAKSDPDPVAAKFSFAAAGDLIAYLKGNAAALMGGADVPVQEGADAPVLIDEQRLGTLRVDFQSRPGAYEKMLAKFCESADQQTAQIESAFAAGDAKALMRQAHSLKGGAASFGAPRLAALAAEVERLASAGDLAHAGVPVRETAACARLTLAEFAGRAATAR